MDETAGVRHITLDMELAGQNETVMSLLTVPADYLDASKISPVGIVLAHGSDAEDWRGPLLEQLAVQFAQAGHVVMRFFCPLKEQRRHRILEKAFDVAATSPYAKPVQKWALVGYDNGARIAAGVGSKVCSRGGVCGFAFLSYPLLDPAPPPPKQKAGAIPPADSVGPLAKLSEFGQPMLFVCGEFDRLCPVSRLKETIAEALPDVDARVVVLEGLSGRFCAPGTKVLDDQALATVVQHVQTFVAAIKEGRLAACPLPKAADLVPSTRPLPDVPESPKREPSPELEEPEPEPEPMAPARAQRAAAPVPAAQAAAGVAAVGVRPGVPTGMIPVMGPNGQPMLIPAAAMANNPAAQQQLMMLQQQMLAAHMQKQQQQQQAGGGGAAGHPAAASAAQQQMQLHMAIMAQQMAAAAAARPAAAPAAQQQGAVHQFAQHLPQQ